MSEAVTKKERRSLGRFPVGINDGAEGGQEAIRLLGAAALRKTLLARSIRAVTVLICQFPAS